METFRLAGIAALTLFFFLTGCYGASSTGDGDTVEAVEQDPLADPQLDLQDEEACTHPTCFIDFPCTSHSFCLDGRTFTRCNNIGCEVFCGTTCCSGAQCSEPTLEDCPEGTVCHMNRQDCGSPPYYAWLEARCLPPRPPADASTDVDYNDWIVPDNYNCGGCQH